MPPRLSIVAPVLNEKENLRALLEDVGDFEFTDYKIVIVDGGSSDGTREVARDFGARVVDGPREGMAAARNKCIEEAEGEYILMVDADFRFPEGLPDDIDHYFDEEKEIIFWNTNLDPGSQKTFVEKIYAAEYQLNPKNMYFYKLVKFVGDLIWPR